MRCVFFWERRRAEANKVLLLLFTNRPGNVFSVWTAPAALWNTSNYTFLFGRCEFATLCRPGNQTLLPFWNTQAFRFPTALISDTYSLCKKKSDLNKLKIYAGKKSLASWVFCMVGLNTKLAFLSVHWRNLIPEITGAGRLEISKSKSSTPQMWSHRPHSTAPPTEMAQVLANNVPTAMKASEIASPAVASKCPMPHNNIRIKWLWI